MTTEHNYSDNLLPAKQPPVNPWLLRRQQLHQAQSNTSLDSISKSAVTSNGHLSLHDLDPVKQSFGANGASTTEVETHQISGSVAGSKSSGKIKPTSRDKWVHYDATIIVDDSHGNSNKNGNQRNGHKNKKTNSQGRKKPLSDTEKSTDQLVEKTSSLKLSDSENDSDSSKENKVLGKKGNTNGADKRSNRRQLRNAPSRRSLQFSLPGQASYMPMPNYIYPTVYPPYYTGPAGGMVLLYPTSNPKPRDRSTSSRGKRSSTANTSTSTSPSPSPSRKGSEIPTLVSVPNSPSLLHSGPPSPARYMEMYLQQQQQKQPQILYPYVMNPPLMHAIPQYVPIIHPPQARRRNSRMDDGKETEYNIALQLDYYFSRENLIKDTYLRDNMVDGYVSLKFVSNFLRMKMMTGGDLSLAVGALGKCKNVEVEIRGDDEFYLKSKFEDVLGRQKSPEKET